MIEMTNFDELEKEQEQKQAKKQSIEAETAYGEWLRQNLGR